MGSFFNSMVKLAKKTNSITLYGLSGLFLALNILIFPQTRLNFNSAIERATSAAVQITELKIEEPAPVSPKLQRGEPAKEEKIAPKRVIYVTVTAYSSTPDQTDDTPFITANGTQVRDGIIAANFLRFGTKIKFPDYFGDKIFEVTDRMNERYPSRADIWMETREEAHNFGIRTLKMEIY